MKPIATPRKSVRRRHSYTKVLDNRKQPIRGLWRRHGNYIARVTVEDDLGRKSKRWCKLAAKTLGEAQEEFRTLLVERSENRLRHIGLTPKLSEYFSTYKERLAVSGKRPRSTEKDRGCLDRWVEALGHHRLDLLRPHHLTAFLDGLKRETVLEDGTKKKGLSGRTVNLYLISMRGLLKAARVDGYIKTLPTEGIQWQRVDTRKRALVSTTDLDALCAKALEVSKNGQQLGDYLRFLAYSGARRDEALRVRWADVDFGRKQLTIGADGETKNREPRHVDFNSNLEAHLREMQKRRAPDSQWLFPSPQRGETDVPSKTFMESLRLARTAAGMPKFGFHDCRHLFISFAVMSGIDFMTIARWAGHKDGGILIGKVYGHLSNDHAQAQASRLNFGPALVTAVG